MSSLSLEEFDEFSNNGITHVSCASRATQILGTDTVVDSQLNSSLNSSSLFGQVERVLEHHGNGEDGANGVDNALARDVGSRA